MQKEFSEQEEEPNLELQIVVCKPKKQNIVQTFEKELQPDSQLLLVETGLNLELEDFHTQEKDQKTEIQSSDMLSVNFLEKQLRNEHQIIRQGLLEKDNDSFLKPWVTCYCVLTYQKLLCFEDQSRTRLVSCLNFRKTDCLIKAKDDSGLAFDLVYAEKEAQHSFRSQSIEVTSQWVSDIHEVIKSFINIPKIKLRKDSHEVYAIVDTLLEEQFFEECESGDILLMKTSDSKCAIQRLVTNSEYDHISMVVKFPNKTVKIFQANADQGVQLYSWQDFNCKFTHFEKICHRKLIHSDKASLHPLLVTFMKKMIGKKYNFGAMKLIRNKSNDEEAESLQSDYFCSELVAKAYKCMGVLGKGKGSNSFWPVDFTSRGGINFEGDTYFGFEKLVILKRHLRMFQ